MISVRFKDFLINLLIASILAAILFGGFFFRKQMEKLGYNLVGIVGKIFPGPPHVKVRGTEVKGFVDNKKIDHLAGTVKAIEPSALGTKLTIEWEGNEEIVLVDPEAAVYFGPKNAVENESTLNQKTINRIEVKDYAMLGLFKKTPNDERVARVVIVIR